MPIPDGTNTRVDTDTKPGTGEREARVWSSRALRRLRLRLGWSQSDMARRLLCETSQVRDWESWDEKEEVKLPLNFQQSLAHLVHLAESVAFDVQVIPQTESQMEERQLQQMSVEELDYTLGDYEGDPKISEDLRSLGDLGDLEDPEVSEPLEAMEDLEDLEVSKSSGESGWSRPDGGSRGGGGGGDFL